MPYVIRHNDGKIKAISLVLVDAPGWEFVEADASEYQDFLEHAIVESRVESRVESSVFRESDIQLARVLEDLIALLIDRDLIRFTDFPAPAQKRLIERQTMRIKGKHLNLIDDETLL